MLTVEGLGVRLDGRTVLEGLDLAILPGETAAVLGPSGVGKTTLLRVIAGLQEPTTGSVSWDGSPLAGILPHRRNFGLMFQDLALFPNLDVAGNVAFGLDIQGHERATKERMVAAALDLVGLAGFGDRGVDSLSGGEQQRVALARSLAPRPRLVMLDEPLGSLDRALRERLADELGEIFAELDIPVLYVTHDQREAFAVADKIAVLYDGRIVQTGEPEEVWRHPRTEAVARFLGLGSIIDAEVSNGSASTVLGPLAVKAAPGHRRLLVRPDAVHVDEKGPIEAEVTSVGFVNGAYAVSARTTAGTVLEFASAERAKPGQRVHLRIDAEGVVALADSG